MEFTTNEKTTQYTNQCAFVLYYKHERNPKELRRLPIRITYVSKKMQAVYFYTDLKLIPQLTSMLKRINGIINFEKAPLFDETLNF